MIVARDLWLKGLIKSLSEHRLHTEKLTKIVECGLSSGGASKSKQLYFTDGSSFEADAVVGCDGIHSKARGIVLSSHDPATARIFGG